MALEVTTPSASSAAGADAAAVVRELIQHEDHLTNQRMSWFLTTQGLLFAAMSFGWGQDPVLVSFVLAPLGLTLAVSFRMILVLGPRTVTRLVVWWEENRPEHYDGPGVVGLQNGDAPRWTGSRAVSFLLWPWNAVPTLIAGAWFAAGILRWLTA